MSENKIECKTLNCVRFFLNFWRTRVLFVGPLIPLFWTSGDISSGTPADLLAADLFHIPVKALVGLERETSRSMSERSTD